MSEKKTCDKCTTVKNGMLSPAIMYTTQPIEHGECNLNCKNDKKPNVIITRVAVLIGLVLLAVLVCNIYKG